MSVRGHRIQRSVLTVRGILSAAVVLLASSSALAVDVAAGPIWNNGDAARRCPQVCSSRNMQWNNQWRTTVPGRMSVCGCDAPAQPVIAQPVIAQPVAAPASRNVEAGPIWNQGHAQRRCPSVCGGQGMQWNGQWSTTIQGRMSVCGCVGAQAVQPQQLQVQIQPPPQVQPQPSGSLGFQRMTTAFRGANMCLDVVNGGPRNNHAELRPCGNYSGQQWHMEPQPNGATRMTTAFRGATMCLDVINGGPESNQIELRPCGNFSGQNWRLAAQSNGSLRLTTDFRGANMCLDVVNGGPRNNQVELRPCGNFSGQAWSTRPGNQ
ncbi:MAG: mannan-binding protein [Deltaproteobacteria bacterium]|nr:mannan-binding protein [Deltaproteobacteria bacterium]